jgi:large subunit ribosomal protein L29
MKARDLRDRSTEDLAELERSLLAESFQNRFKNFTNRLDDTSVIGKSKRDLARVKLILAERARGITVVYKAPEAAPQKPKTRPPKPPKEAKAEAADHDHDHDDDHDHDHDHEKAPPSKKKAAKPAAKAAPAAKTKAKAEPADKPAAKKPKAKTEKSK